MSQVMLTHYCHVECQRIKSKEKECINYDFFVYLNGLNTFIKPNKITVQ